MLIFFHLRIFAHAPSSGCLFFPYLDQCMYNKSSLFFYLSKFFVSYIVLLQFTLFWGLSWWNIIFTSEETNSPIFLSLAPSVSGHKHLLDKYPWCLGMNIRCIKKFIYWVLDTKRCLRGYILFKLLNSIAYFFPLFLQVRWQRLRKVE